jgi:hypothetical protein
MKRAVIPGADNSKELNKGRDMLPDSTKACKETLPGNKTRHSLLRLQEQVQNSSSSAG